MNQRAVSLYNELTKSIYSNLLSKSLSLARRLAREVEDSHFEKWVRLELGGYYKDNPARTDDLKLPEYRLIVGEYRDTYNRPLRLNADWYFLNKHPIHDGVEELEQWIESKSELALQQPEIIQAINDRLGVNVDRFVFNSTTLVSVLSAIKMMLADWLDKVESLNPDIHDYEWAESKASLDNLNRSITINVEEKATVSNLIISNSIKSSFNKIDTAEISDQLKSSLRDLAEAVQLMISKSSEEDAELIVRDYETFTAEVTSKRPREKWYKLSAEGLEKAAHRLGAIGKPVLELVALIVSIISPH